MYHAVLRNFLHRQVSKNVVRKLEIWTVEISTPKQNFFLVSSFSLCPVEFKYYKQSKTDPNPIWKRKCESTYYNALQK